MPLPAKQRTAADELRRLLKEDLRPLKEIARDAGVPYVPLWKWVNKRQASYNLLQGERVFFFLTGRTFLR